MRKEFVIIILRIINIKVWLGGMFFPEAYITATRQLIAQNNGWSLEQLHMHVVAVGESGGADQAKGISKFTLTGIGR